MGDEGKNKLKDSLLGYKHKLNAYACIYNGAVDFAFNILICPNALR